MKYYTYPILLILITLLFQSCYNDVGPIEPEIQVTEVSFADDIQLIFTQNCTSCHPNSGNLDLTQENAYSQIVNKTTAGYSGIRVVPNEPENSILYKKIDHSNSFGANMPLGGTLTANEINLIKKWILEGALNN